MTVGLDAPTALRRPGLPAPEERVGPTDALEDIIAAHRTALLELAPHQRERSVREDTGWHMAELGLLLCHRDRQRATQTPPHPAHEALRTGQAASVQAAWAYREAGGDPVEEIMTLLPQAPGEGLPQQQSAARGVGSRERQEESTGPDRQTR